MATILDARGNPIVRTALSEPQTARMASLHQEFADHPARGITPQKLHALLTNAEQGDLRAQSDLFDDMEERDSHIFAEMGKRKRALLTLDWRVEPPPDASSAEKSLAEFAQQRLIAIAEMEELILDALTAIGHGFSCLEISWAAINGELMPDKIEYRPQSWFTVDRATRTQLRLRSAGSIEGDALNPFGWIVHQHKSRSGYLARTGLYRSLVWPFLFKNYASRDLAEFLEIYGLPLRLGKYPTSATVDERRTLLNAVVNIGHAAAGIIPEGMMIEFQEAAKGSHEPHMAMIEWCERSVSKAILGQNIGNDSAKKGSLAGSVVDNEIRRDILKSDARQLQGTLTRDLVYPILAINKGLSDIRRCPRFVFDIREVQDISRYADSLPKLASIGMQIPAKWAHEKLSIPEPVNGEPVLETVAAAQGQSAVPQAAARTALKSAVPADKNTDVTPIEPLTAAMSREAQPALTHIIDQVRALVMSANTLAELRDALVSAYGDIDSAQLSQIMALGFSVADLTGRFDSQAESNG